MSWSLGAFTFLNAWWVMLFFVLPFYTRVEGSHAPEEYAAAPKAVNWKKALITNTLLSLAMTLIIAIVINSNAFPMRQ